VFAGWSGEAPLNPTLVILNVTEGGVRDLLYLPFNIGAERRSTISKFKAVKNWMPIPSEA
jgi:hypothetical protein